MTDLPLVMVRDDLQDIPCASFPHGFRLRTWKPCDEGLWLDVQRDAERVFEVQDDLFEQEFGHDRRSAEERVFFIVNERNVAVGTLSSWLPHEEFDASYGRVHWVAVRPSHQGLGLAKAALSEALMRMRQWHSRSYLLTSSSRLAALKLYTDFGFRPDLRPEGATDSWQLVRQSLPQISL